MRKLIGVIVSLLIVLQLPISVLADELDDAKSQLKNANQSINENKEKLKEIQAEQSAVAQQLENLDSKMNELSVEISKLTTQINTTNQDIDGLTGEIEVKIQEIEEQEQLLEQRLVVMYKRGNIGYINVIFSADSFTEMIEKSIYVERIISNDKQLIANLENNKKKLEESKASLETKKAELEQIKINNSTKLTQLNSQSNEKKQLMDKLKEDKETYKKLIEQEEKDAEALKQRIKKLEAMKVTITDGKLYCVTGTPYAITSYYGNRFHPVLNTYRFHAGIDIGVYTGTPIYALKDGQVVYSGYMSGYGNVIMIHHGDIISLYAHNSALLVQEGAQVKGGQLIAKSGNSGLSTGPHLHFEIRKPNGETINAINYYIRN